MKYIDWLKRKKLKYRDGDLFFDGISTLDLTNEFGTPLYVTSEKLIREHFRELNKNLKTEYKESYIYYAVKANSNLTILKILDSEGSFFDCTSVGEIKACLKVGIKPNKILYTGNMFTNDDFRYAVEYNVTINLDSLSQLKRLSTIYEELEKENKIISFRINPEFGAGHHSHTITAGKEVKFGILEDQVIKAYSKAKKLGFNRFGIHQHIGSGILDPLEFKRAVEKYLAIISKLIDQLNLKFDFIDFGGGLGIPYRPNENPLDLNLYKKIVLLRFKEFIKRAHKNYIKVIIEPGRYIVAESTILLAQVNTIKNNGYKLFAGVNAGFNTLIRPTMYGSYHHIINCQIHSPNKKVYDITGPICESGDILGKNRELNELDEKDYLSILDTGAYGFSMGSNYNSRPRPAEIILHNHESYLMRKSESYKDLFKLQVFPEFLKNED
ncbi:MAG: diaminopimelate decarboxylase [Candidatus Lokiarchaeota archaeon]